MSLVEVNIFVQCSTFEIDYSGRKSTSLCSYIEWKVLRLCLQKEEKQRKKLPSKRTVETAHPYQLNQMSLVLFDCFHYWHCFGISSC